MIQALETIFEVHYSVWVYLPLSLPLVVDSDSQLLQSPR